MEPMTHDQIQLVKTSWAQVAPIAPQAAALFYGRLFELDSALRQLFKGDMTEQGAKLMTMIGMAVQSLDNLAPLLPAIRESGIRHGAYGVKAQDYDTVGSALLWTLEQGLGAAFTPAVKEAWAAAYTALANTMKQASAKAA
jgi:hemoglobin-like flavoprotein